MWKFIQRLAKLPFGDVTRRALEETAADAQHDRRGAAYLAAAGRIVLMALASLTEENPMRNVGRDVFYALRRLRSTPMFTVFSIITLALGIGATTAIYSVIYAVVWRPIGIRDVDRVVNIYQSKSTMNMSSLTLSWPDFEDLKAQQTVFSDVAGWARIRPTVTADGRAELMMGETVTGGYFQVMGIEPALGRLLQPADELPAASSVVVISHFLWQRWFNGDPGIIGKRLSLGRESHEIVGVTPATFRGVDMANLMPTPLWVPARNTQREIATRANDRSVHMLFVKGRLKPGRTIEEAATEVGVIARRLEIAFPSASNQPERYVNPSAGRPWYVRPAGDVHTHETVDPVAMPIAATVLGAVGLVLLVACTNIANLMLARGSGRRHEVAVRLALGASRARLVREAMVESGLVAFGGGLAGIVLAQGLMVVVLSSAIHLAPGVTMQLEPRFNPAVAGVAVAATLLTLVVFGLIPAGQSTRADVRSALAGDGSSGALPRWRGRRVLIAAQVAVSTVLLAVAVLAVQQLRAAAAHDPGFDVDHLVAAQIDFGATGFTEERSRQVLRDVAARAREQGGIVSVAIASTMPVAMNMPEALIGTGDRPVASASATWNLACCPSLITVEPEAFGTIGLTIVRGRAFDGRDAAGAEHVGIVSESIALKAFGTKDAVGRSLQYRPRPSNVDMNPPIDTIAIVGVTADTDGPSLGRPRTGALYLPFAQHFTARMSVVARTSGDPTGLAGTLRSLVAAADSRAVVFDAGTAAELAGGDNLVPKVTADVAGLLGLLAFVLAMVGLYGVLSHVVARRTREMGVRIALGADRSRILQLVIRQGLGPVVAGLVVGLGFGVLARLSLRGVFVRVFPALDPLVLALVPLAFLAAASVACYLPARRAARVDPMVALRDL